VSPLGLGDSLTLVQSSTNVVLTRMRFTAAGTRFRSEVDLDHSAHVRVVHSVFSHCGDRSRQWTLCLRPVWASFVDIEHNWFHDCQGCDFIHGFAGESLTIMHNRFNRALRCPFKWEKCFHQDMIELFAANGIRVSRNRFGVSQFGGAQLYLTGAVNHVRVFNNLFKRRDPRVPGIQSHVGIVIGARTSAEVPQDVEIINNTILSGRTKPSHKASSIVLAPRYGLQPVSTRPLVANNILGRARSILVLCRDIRSIKNVMLRGYACSASDQVGPANLDNQYRPTPASTLLLGQADAALAPSEDIVGHRRIDPEIGCYEFEGGRL
jgi:hypothetical protein